MSHTSSNYPQATPLTISLISERLLYYQLLNQGIESRVLIYESRDAKRFERTNLSFSVKNLADNHVSIAQLSSMSIVACDGGYRAVMTFEGNSFEAESKDGLEWSIIRSVPKSQQSAVLVTNHQHKEQDILYWADRSIRIGLLGDGDEWKMYDDPIYTPYLHKDQTMKVLSTVVGREDLYVIYTIETQLSKSSHFSLNVAVFSQMDPRRVSWRFSYPFWSVPEQLIGRITQPIAVVVYHNEVYSFWQGATPYEILSVRHPLFEQLIHEDHTVIPTISLNKAEHNPILSPNPGNSWESRAVFNPAAYYDEDADKVHLMYRAVGDSWMSVIGYASSDDGLHIDMTHSEPAYVPREAFEGMYVAPDPSSPFTSGPGTGGCEDPRITRIDNTMFLTYVAYDGVSGPRVALSSIDYDDFVHHRWSRWSPPQLISRPGVVDKNACIFPEKIRGKYVVMHRIFPHILVDFVDDLRFEGDTYLKGEFKIAPRAVGWDSRKVGAGAPPIRTDQGWLLIYHAVDDKQDHQYKIGAMLLDLEDPTKVLHRCNNPIISPTHWYENDGHKAGVVYPCGAVIRDNKLHVYYGGADTYVCVATSPLDEFMAQLTSMDANSYQEVRVH